MNRDSKTIRACERAISVFGFHFLALGLIYLVASLASSETALRVPDLTAEFRWSLVFKEVQFLGGLAFLHSFVFLGLLLVLPERSWKRVSRGWLALGIVALEIGVLLGWLGYFKGGNLPTYRLISFTLANFGQVVEHAMHIYFKTFWLFVISIPVVTAVIWSCFEFGYNRIGAKVRWGLGVLCCLFSVFAFNQSFTGVEVDLGPIANKDPQNAKIRLWLNKILREKTGPLTAIYCDYLHEERRLAELVSDESVEVFQSSLSSPEQWREQVDLANAKNWNVLFVIVESLRNDILLTSGAGENIMPNVNALARESSVWSNNYSQATHSNYADISPISSQYPLRDGTDHVYPKNASYPRSRIYDLLKTVGYRTAIVSSQNEEWGRMANFLESDKLDHFFHSQTFNGDTYLPSQDTGFASMASKVKLSGKIDDQITVGEAVRWIGESEDPFYLYLNLQNSHFPYVVPAGYERPFAPEAFDAEVGFNDVPDEYLDVMKRRYWDSLHYSDTQLGKLFEYLKSSGRWDNTLVVLTGDTGQAFGEHGFTCHANQVYDETLRTPVVFRSPGDTAGVHTGLSEHVDVPPSILEALNLPAYEGFQGESVLSEAKDGKEAVYVMVQTPLAHQYAIISGGHKLLYDYTYGFYELYDLVEDPGETRDVIGYADLDMIEDLDIQLRSWRAEQILYYKDLEAQKTHFPPVLGSRKK